MQWYAMACNGMQLFGKIPGFYYDYGIGSYLSLDQGVL
tara:strand:- start:1635 stop:1748 length:114 start_codon:yes stop_codon:yes gene_type:complete